MVAFAFSLAQFLAGLGMQFLHGRRHALEKFVVGVFMCGLHRQRNSAAKRIAAPDKSNYHNFPNATRKG
jgi:hypothetical protein